MTDILTDTPAKVKGPILIVRQVQILYLWQNHDRVNNLRASSGAPWVLTCLFLAIRLFTRIHSFGRVSVDDFLTVAAWLILFTIAIIGQTQLHAMYAEFQLNIGALAPTPDALATNARFMRTEAAEVLLFYICLWSIKFSCLVFFWRIGANLPPYRIWVWCVLAFAVGSLVVCIGNEQYACLLNS